MKKLKALIVWATSTKGRLAINHTVTGLVAIYLALHRAGL